MTILFKLLRKRAGGSMEPLHVSMTGVRMGERFLMIGCDDRALLGGLASKVGLSGAAAVAVFDEPSAARARAVGVKIGALIDVQLIDSTRLPLESDAYDMVVVDDTHEAFSAIAAESRRSYLREARRVVRSGGRIEVVERIAGGRVGSRRATGHDTPRDLGDAGFKPVRVLAERDGLRFVEGLNAGSSSDSPT